MIGPTVDQLSQYHTFFVRITPILTVSLSEGL
jgi:hypothetical protein